MLTIQSVWEKFQNANGQPIELTPEELAVLNKNKPQFTMNRNTRRRVDRKNKKGMTSGRRRN